MKKVLAKGLFIFTALSMVVSSTGVNLVTISIANAQEVVSETSSLLSNDKYTVCHATEDEGHYNRLNIPWTAVLGHFDNNGTPVSGHEDDIFLGIDNENVLQCSTPEQDPYPIPVVVSATLNPSNDSALIIWEEITDERLDGYKVLMSTTDPNPSYDYPGGGGYIAWITDSNTTQFDFNYDYLCDTTYYFSVTALYDNHDEPSEFVPALESKSVNFACEPQELECEGADLEFYVDLYVMGEQCLLDGDPNYQIEDSEVVNLVDPSATYEVYAEVHRSGLHTDDPYIQDNEEFTLRVNASSKGPIVLDQPAGETLQLQYAGDFSFNNGDNTVYINTAYQCENNPDPYIRNSVEVKKLCLYKIDEPVFECGNGILEQGETCDDGNTIDEYCGDQTLQVGDYCNSTCTEEIVLNEQCDFGEGNGGEECTLQCQIPEDPERPYAPWCSAMLGMLKAYYNPASSDYMVYNDVIDLNNDQSINLSDVGLLTALYLQGNNEACYTNFEDPEGEYHFQCEDPNVGWCEGLVQGVSDSVGGNINDPESNYFYVYDLNDDGVIDLTDVALSAQYLDNGDEVACYAEFVPPFSMCEDDGYSPYCGDGLVNQEWEECEANMTSNIPNVGCSEQCQFVTPECSDLTLAKIEIDDVQNWGNGDMTSDIFLGSADYKIPSNVWFALYWNGNYYIDSDLADNPQYEDVPGMSVQRLENSLRVVMHGSGLEADKEHVDGKIKFYNATVVGQRNDTSNAYPKINSLENGFDGTGVNQYNPGNDEVWIDNNMSYNWLTTTTADDGYYTDWSIIEDCEEPEVPYAPWCSALLGVVKHSLNTPSYNMVADINNDQAVNLSDVGFVSQMYYAGDDEGCYQEFDNPEGGFQFQCQDPTVGWCSALLQGITDTVNQPDRYFEHYDLNDDGFINLTDVSMVAQYMADPVENSTTCYSHFVPPFEMCVEPGNPPVITLIGNNPVYIYAGDVYFDAGATAYDDEDGDITEDIATNNPIDVNVVGTYTITYNVSDSDGNPAQEITRTVVVQSRSGGCTTNCGGGGNTPPDISNVQVATSCQNDATITWSTSKDSLTWMVWGSTQSYGQENEGTEYTANHSITLTGLEPGATYHYLVKSKGLDGSSRNDSDRTFTVPTTESCGSGPEEPKEPEEPGPVPPEVLGVKDIACDFLRPSGSHGPDKDIDNIFQYPDGSLLRDACSPEMMVYLIREQKKWHVPNLQYLADHFLGQRIYNVLTDVLDNYPDWTANQQILGIKEYADGSLIRGTDMKVYIIENGHKRHIHTLKELLKYAGQPIYNVSDEVLNRY